MPFTLPDLDDFRILIQEELSRFRPVNFPEPDLFIDKKEAAELLGGVCRSTIDNLRRHGVLKSYKIGRAVRFKRSEVLESIEGLNSSGRG